MLYISNLKGNSKRGYGLLKKRSSENITVNLRDIAESE